MTSTVGYGLIFFAMFVASINFYLSFIRPLIARSFGQSISNVTGLPMLGTLLLIAGVLCVDRTTAVLTLVATQFFLDTGGLAWFVVAILRNAVGKPKNGSNAN